MHPRNDRGGSAYLRDFHACPLSLDSRSARDHAEICHAVSCLGYLWFSGNKTAPGLEPINGTSKI